MKFPSRNHSLRHFTLPFLLIANAKTTAAQRQDGEEICGRLCQGMRYEIAKIRESLDWLESQLYFLPEDPNYPDLSDLTSTNTEDDNISSTPGPLNQQPQTGGLAPSFITILTSTPTTTPVQGTQASDIEEGTPGNQETSGIEEPTLSSPVIEETTSIEASGVQGSAFYTHISKETSSSVVQVVPVQTPQIQEPTMGFRSVAYFTNWGIYGRNYPPSKIPVEKLTHILYAFGDNKPDGTVFLTDTWSDLEKHYEGDSWNDVGTNMYGNLKQLNLFKRRNRNLKVLLSIGGWTYTNTNKHLDEPASSPEGRLQFAKSCVQLIKDLGFDGIDIDWEYPQNPGQGEQLLLLLQAIRHEMDAYAQSLVTQRGYNRAPHFELSIAAPAGKSKYRNLPLDRLAGALDFINLMGYDYTGAWANAASHQANLYSSQSNPSSTPFNTHAVINDYIAAGVPSHKIVLGSPLYGRAFTNTTGLGKPYQGVGAGDWENGIWDYKNLPKAGAQVLYDQEAGGSYSWDPANGGTLISYDTPYMAQKKADYIAQRQLGGTMWWELSADRPITDPDSLILNTLNRLTSAPNNGSITFSENWVYYPDSKYENMRAGFPNDNAPIHGV